MDRSVLFQNVLDGNRFYHLITFANEQQKPVVNHSHVGDVFNKALVLNCN